MIITAEIEWPATLPLPFFEFSGTEVNASISSPLESPRIHRRSRFTVNSSTHSVRWVLTEDQLEEFQDFFLTTLGNGVSCFSIDLRFPRISELTNWLVRFEGGYAITKSDGLPVVEAALRAIRVMEVPDAAS